MIHFNSHVNSIIPPLCLFPFPRTPCNANRITGDIQGPSIRHFSRRRSRALVVCPRRRFKRCPHLCVLSAISCFRPFLSSLCFVQEQEKEDC